METVVHWMIYLGAGLTVLYFFPLTREIVRPILNSFGAMAVYVGSEGFAWVVFVIKAIIHAHQTCFRHLTTSRVEMVPEEKVRMLEKESRSRNKKGQP